MNFFILIPTFALIANIFVWSYIFGQRLQDPVSRRFLISSAAVSGWLIGDILLMTPLSIGYEAPILVVQSAFWIPTGFLFMHFCYAIAGKRSDWLTYTAGALCALECLIFGTTDWVLIGHFEAPWGRALHARFYPLIAYALTNIILAFYALVILFNELKHASDSGARAILHLILGGGTVATVSITAVSFVIPDVLGIHQFPRIGSPLMIIFILIVFIAVTKYRFLVISVDKVAEELFDEIEDGILLIDRSGSIQRANHVAEYLLEDSQAGAVLKNLFGEMLAHPHVKMHEVTTYVENEERTLSVSVANASYRSALVGKIVVIRDITEQRYAQAVLKASRDDLEQEVERRVLELRHAQKMEAIGTLAGGIAHDFNNILAAISGFTHAALQALPSVHPIRSDLNEVMIASRRAREIVQQVLTFSRPKDRSTYQLVSVRSLIDEAVELLQIASPLGIEIATAMSIEKGAVSCDTNQLSQVLLNLGANAFQSMTTKQTKQGQTLRIEADKIELSGVESVSDLPLFPGLYARIRFVDEGCGMSEETLAHVFDPFYNTNRPGEGTGLGLSTAYEIVKNHDGVITAVSALDQGSCFTVYLPLLAETRDSSVPHEDKIQRGSEHIMVVDDEIPLQRLARRLLEPLGYRVTTFSNGPDALTYFNTGMVHVDMVITDQTMPEMTGIQLAQHLLERRPNLPIILMSGYGIAVEEEDVLAVGIRKFLKKPLPSRRFPLEIRTLLDQQQASRDDSST